MSNKSMESESEGLTGLMEITAHAVFFRTGLLLFDTFVQLHVGGNFFLFSQTCCYKLNFSTA